MKRAPDGQPGQQQSGPSPPTPPTAIDPRSSLASLGEWNALGGLLGHLAASGNVDVELGPGDDAAAVAIPANELAVLSTDTLVENVHFQAAWSWPEDLGYRLIAVAASDLAAMASKPLGVLVAMSAPGLLRYGELIGLCDGMLAAAGDFGLRILGGDTTASPLLVMTATVLGTGRGPELARRDGAQVGDRVLVTGRLGESVTGLRVLQCIHDARESGDSQQARHTHWLAAASPLEELGGRWSERAWKSIVAATVRETASIFGASAKTPVFDESTTAKLQESLSASVRHFLRPRPMIEAAMLARERGATAMIDISDGLSSELHHLASASGVGFRLTADWVPVGGGARAWGYLRDRRPLELALIGGEDFELLFTAPPEAVAAITTALGERGVLVSEIGEAVDAAEGLVLVESTGDTQLGRQGYEHFGKAWESRRGLRP